MRESVTIDKPIEFVWALVRDLRRAPEWQSSLVSVDVEAGTEVRSFAGRTQTARFVVVEDDAPRRLVITSEGGPAEARATMQLEQAGDGTRVDFELDLQLSGAARLMGGVVRPAIEPETRANLEQLKQLAEAPPHA